MPAYSPAPVRFMRHVKETPTCWEWTAARRPTGYGKFHVTHGKTATAHRWLWEYVYGPIPENKHLCHTCDNPPCVRPDHLYIGDPIQL